jgi:CheY-like chemotaxis protein
MCGVGAADAGLNRQQNLYDGDQKNSTMKNARVLVIDDHHAHSEGLAELLSLKGFETLSTTSGIRGLEIVSEWKPDALLTGLEIPDVNGFEICRRTRAKPEPQSIALISHTGSQSIPDPDAQYEAFLTYPVETSDLVLTITGSILRRRKRSADLGQNA